MEISEIIWALINVKSKFNAKKFPWELLLIALVGFAPFFWFKNGQLVSHFDFLFPIKPLLAFHRTLFAWGESNSLGTLQPFSGLPQIIFFSLLSKIGISVSIIEKIFFATYLWIMGFSAYFLGYTIVDFRKSPLPPFFKGGLIERVFKRRNNPLPPFFKGGKNNKKPFVGGGGNNKRVAGFICAVIYLFNPFSINVIWQDLLLQLSFATLPLILALFIRMLRSKNGFCYALAIGVIMNFSKIDLNPNSFAPIFFLFSYAFYFWMKKPKDYPRLIRMLKMCFMTLFFWISLGLWWLIPQIFFLSNRYSEAVSSLSKVGLSVSEIIKFMGEKTRILDVLRLNGVWGDPRYPTFTAFDWTYLGFIFPAMAFFSLIFRKKSKGSLLPYFGATALIGLFLSKGAQPPLGEMFSTLLKLPFSGAFRQYYLKFAIIPALSFSCMAGIAATKFKIPLNPPFKKRERGGLFSILGGILLLAFILTSPIVRGTFLPPNAVFQIPSYYGDASRWLSGQKGDFRVLPLPRSKIYLAAFRWQRGYFGPDPSLYIYDKNVITSLALNEELFEQLIRGIQEHNDVTQMLNSLNVKYVIFHKDADWKFVEFNPLWVLDFRQKLEDGLNGAKGLAHVKDFGELAVYKNMAWVPSHIYVEATTRNKIPPAPLLQRGDKREISQKERQPPAPLLQRGDKREISQKERQPPAPLLQRGEKEGILSYRMASPVQYTITLNSRHSFDLIFSENFNKGWRLYHGQKSALDMIFGKPAFDDSHKAINGFANTWKIPSTSLRMNEKPGKYQLTLFFFPQLYFYIGLFLSGLTLLSVVIYSFFRWKLKGTEQNG